MNTMRRTILSKEWWSDSWLWLVQLGMLNVFLSSMSMSVWKVAVLVTSLWLGASWFAHRQVRRHVKNVATLATDTCYHRWETEQKVDGFITKCTKCGSQAEATIINTQSVER